MFRLHGDRLPFYPPEQEYIGGVRQFDSGEENEIWSYGEENEKIMRSYILMREKMRPYIRTLMELSHEHGDPVIRPMFFDFPGDTACQDIYDQYMFGPDIIAAPVMYENQTSRKVYLPGGVNWVNIHTGDIIAGRQTINADAPIHIIPVFAKEGSEVLGLLRAI